MTKHDNVSQGKIMKATEFVKKFGLNTTENYADHCVNINDLKRLVESHELVEFFGSLDDAIQIYEYSKDMEILSYGGREIPTKQLGQAIADVEACQ